MALFKHWKHMFDEYNFYPDSGKLWKKSSGFLERAVAVPITINMSNSQIQQIGEKLQTISKKV